MRYTLVLLLLCADLFARPTGFLGLQPGWQNLAPWDSGLLSVMAGPLPKAYDARTATKVFPAIRNQGQCGSCWVFGTMAAVEGAFAVKKGIALDLSEQDALSCSGAGSCFGGYFTVSDYYVSPGVALEADFPYKARDLRCPNLERGTKIAEWHYIGTQGHQPLASEIKAAILEYGTVATVVHVGSRFQRYNSGVFTQSEGGQINHLVSLVGWDDDTHSWILRNSWGTGWGEQGYMRIRYGASNVGLVAAYVKLLK